MHQILWEGDTTYGHYQVVDTPYDGRPARVLYSGNGRAAQSGIAQDDDPRLLFDYNQRFLELAEGLQPERVLIIGGGAGTLATALVQALPNVRVDMVEPDDGLTKLAYQFFGLPVEERLRIFHTDGRAYLQGTADRYDLLIVDAFHHTTIPHDLQTLEAFQAYAKHLSRRGMLAVNVISGYYGPGAHVLEHMYMAALHAFAAVDIFLASKGYSLWLPQNFVMAAQKVTGMHVNEYTRGSLIQPPEVSPDVVLRDGP